MLSTLQQGSLVYIIDKTKNIKYSVGEIITKTEPKTEYNSSPVGGMNMVSYFDMSVKINNDTYDFKHIPSVNTLVNYNNGNIIISETKEGLIPTIETLLHNSKQIVNNIDYHKQAIVECEEILKELNPTFAKEKERDERIDSLEEKVGGIDEKLDKIFNLINDKK